MGLVKIKDDKFRWRPKQQKAFDEIKDYLSMPPVLVPPQQGKSFYVYLFVGDMSITSVLIQHHEGQERVIFYLNRWMLDAETRYPPSRSYVSAYSSLVPSFGTCRLKKQSSFVNQTSSSTCYQLQC